MSLDIIHFTLDPFSWLFPKDKKETGTSDADNFSQEADAGVPDETVDNYLEFEIPFDRPYIEFAPDFINDFIDLVFDVGEFLVDILEVGFNFTIEKVVDVMDESLEATTAILDGMSTMLDASFSAISEIGDIVTNPDILAANVLRGIREVEVTLY